VLRDLPKGVLRNRLSTHSGFSLEKEPGGFMNVMTRRECNAISRRECCAIACVHVQIFPLRRIPEKVPKCNHLSIHSEFSLEKESGGTLNARSPSKYPKTLEITDLSFDGKRLP